MSCYLKTCLSQFLLLVALAVPVFATGCDRDSDPPIEPQVRGAMRASPLAAAEAAEPGTPGSKPAELNMSDPAITARVKTALIADEEVKGLRIDVDTEEGRVTLKGDVATDAQVKRAIEVARAVDGVREVVNRLSVKAEDKASRSTRG